MRFFAIPFSLFLIAHSPVESESPPDKSLQAHERKIYSMGTWAQIVIYSPSRQQAISESEKLAEILERTEKQLTTWDSFSAMSKINQLKPGEAASLDEDLCLLFRQLFRWEKETNGAFNPAVGALVDAWGLREEGRIPSSAELVRARSAGDLNSLNLREDCTLAKKKQVKIDSGAFGKGEALRRALELSAEENLSPWLINFGGQVTVWRDPPGKSAWKVDLANPGKRYESLDSLQLTYGALATSGSLIRDRWIKGERIGHILDPRTGKPAEFVGQVTVWANNPLLADILSTALFVLGPGDGVEWAEERNLAALFIDAESMKIFASNRFLETFEFPDSPNL